MVLEDAHHQESFNRMLVTISESLHRKNLQKPDEITS